MQAWARVSGLGPQGTIKVACNALDVAGRQALHEGSKLPPVRLSFVNALFKRVGIPSPLIAACNIHVPGLAITAYGEPDMQQPPGHNDAVLKRGFGDNALGDEHGYACPAVAGIRRADHVPTRQCVLTWCLAQSEVCFLQQQEVESMSAGLQPSCESVIRCSAKTAYVKRTNPKSLARCLVAGVATALSWSRAVLQRRSAAETGGCAQSATVIRGAFGRSKCSSAGPPVGTLCSTNS